MKLTNSLTQLRKSAVRLRKGLVLGSPTQRILLSQTLFVVFVVSTNSIGSAVFEPMALRDGAALEQRRSRARLRWVMGTLQDMWSQAIDLIDLIELGDRRRCGRYVAQVCPL